MITATKQPVFPFLCRLAVMCLCAWLVVGCTEDGPPPIADFEDAWYEGLDQKDYAALYDLLDAASQRKIAHDLEQLRGLDEPQQQQIINQLGGVRHDNLLEYTPREYFARLWHLATEGSRPRLRIEPADDVSATLVLSDGNGHTQQFRVFVEGGRWTWELPRQDFDPPSP